MKKERGCARNHLMRGGGTATFSTGSMIQPGFYPEIKTIDSCSVARPGMLQFNNPKGLMGGGRRVSRRRASRRHGRRRTMRGGDCGCSGAGPKLFGGSYKMDLAGQGMQPNQYAEVVKMPCDGQKGGAPFIEMPSVSYGFKPDVIATEGGGVVPVMMPQAYDRTAISSACTKTGGRRRSVRRRRAKKGSRRHARK